MIYKANVDLGFMLQCKRFTKLSDSSCKHTLGVQEAWINKVESCLEVSALRDWQQLDLVSEYGQGLAC